MKSYSVYMHTCPNSKKYIGITCRNPLYRWNHGNGYRRNEHFFRAIVKYGWDNIKHEILFDGLTEEEACAIEVELIAKYKSNDARYGYNKDNGGVTGCKIKERTKSKQKFNLETDGLDYLFKNIKPRNKKNGEQKIEKKSKKTNKKDANTKNADNVEPEKPNKVETNDGKIDK